MKNMMISAASIEALAAVDEMAGLVRMNVVPFAGAPKRDLAPEYRMAKKETKAGPKGEIYIYGIIGSDWWGEGITAKRFADDLTALGDVKEIDLRFNSDGGDVFAAKAMYSLLMDRVAKGVKITSYVDGIAASAASFLAMAGSTIVMGEGAFYMIHDPWTIALGNEAEMQRIRNLLLSVGTTIINTYAKRTGQDPAELAKMMKNETWMTAAEAKEKGFCDTIVEDQKVAARTIMFDFKNIPAALRPNRAAAVAKMAALRQTATA